MSEIRRTWCYSLNEENFDGQYETEEEAKAEAEQELDDNIEIGDLATYWIAQSKPAEEFLNPDTIGQNIQENLDEWLADDIGWDDVIVQLTSEKSRELGQLVLKFIRDNDGFKVYGVTKPVSHGYVRTE
jgi:hypothetical protein